jgi:dTDP-D-glucose 4,6-dehydratase
MIMEVFRPSAVLVTGGAGFIGSNLVRWLLEREPDLHVINLDVLTYAGNLESLRDVDRRFGPEAAGRYSFVHGDIRDTDLVASGLKEFRLLAGVSDAKKTALATPLSIALVTSFVPLSILPVFLAFSTIV